MKRIVLIFFVLIAILVANCSNEEKTVADMRESELVEAYVQISLIYESERGLAEKDARVEAYLDENNLSKQKIDRMLDKYKSNPNEWRDFFMKVQSRLRELEAQQRTEIAAADSIRVIETEKLLSIETEFPTIIDTVITRAVDAAATPIIPGEPGDKIGSSSQKRELVGTLVNNVDSRIGETSKFELEEVADEVRILEEQKDITTEEIADEIDTIGEPEEIKTEYGLGFIYYTIKRGDNLSTLAKDHDSKTTQLMMVNSLENANSIKIGQTLLIPNRSTMVLLHTISSGEVLSKIAKRYFSDLDLLIEINGIRNVNSIKAGDFLYVPVLKGE